MCGWQRLLILVELEKTGYCERVNACFLLRLFSNYKLTQ